MCVLLWIKLCESMYTPHPVHHANNCAPTLQSKDFWHMHNKTGMFWGLCVKSCGQWHFTPRGRETTKVLYQQNSWTAPANTERRMEDALLFFQSQLVEFCRQLMTVVHWFTKLFSVVYFLLLLVLCYMQEELGHVFVCGGNSSTAAAASALFAVS